MQKHTTAQRLSDLFLVAVLTAHLVLVCTTRLYPFLDMPNHLALATIYRFYDDPATAFSAFCTIDVFPKPNIFHLLFCGSDMFPSVETANKVFYCLYLVLFVTAAVLIIRAIGGNRWYVLLVPLLFYNCNVSYGFVGCTMAIPIVLLVLYCMLRDAQGAGVGNAIALAALLTSLFFLHALMAGFALLFFVCWVCWHYGSSWKKACGRIACTIPCAGLLVSWWIRDSATYAGKSMLPALGAYYLQNYFDKFFLRAGFLVHDNFRFWGGPVGYAVAFIFSCLIIAGTMVPLRHRRNNLLLPLSDRLIRPIIVFFVCAMTCVVLFPDALPGYSFLFERFSVFVMLSLIFFGSLFATNRPARFFPAIMVAACAIHFGLWADCMRSFNKENEGFTKDFLNAAPPCRTLAGLIYEYRFRAASLYDNFADYFIVWNRRIATSRTFDERSFPIRRAASKTMLPPYLEWVGKHGAYDGRYGNLDCILVRGDIPDKDITFFEGYQLARTAGKWKLFQKCIKNR